MAPEPFSLRGNIVEIMQQRIRPAKLTIRAGRIEKIEWEGTAVDPDLKYISPGFIDAHVHIESSLLTPTEFARLAVVHGTVATVSDPHEIANVLGSSGVDYMLACARRTPFHFFFAAPSCVPATTFETAGATLDANAVEELLQREEIRYLGEMMNYPGVLHGDAEVGAKLKIARRLGKPIDGHAPGLRGHDAQQYAAAGISTDHECFAIDEARDKLACGMKIIIREGSAAKNFDELQPLIDEHPAEVMLCSDDKHPDSLVLGHINQLCARAVAAGRNVFHVLQAACHNPVQHYKLPVGQLQEGDAADLVVLHNLQTFEVHETYLQGQRVALDGVTLLPHQAAETPNNFAAVPRKPSEFEIKAASAQIRVIEALDGQLITRERILPAKISAGLAVSDVSRDVLKLAVVNRYRPAAPTLAFVQNFGLQRGAIASSVAHDSHNIIAVGVDDDDLCAAINLVIEQRGGLAVACENELDVLPLPVAGLLTTADGYQVAQHYTQLNHLVSQLGGKLAAPYMTLSFLALLVIPRLKLSALGLFDGQEFKFVPLFV